MNKIQQIVGWASDNRSVNLDGKELNVLEFELLLTEKIEALFIADVVHFKIMEIKTYYVINKESGMTLAFINAETEKEAVRLLKKKYDMHTVYIKET